MEKLRKMENRDKCFVKDIYAASALFAEGKKLLRLQRDGKLFWFVFENKEECEQSLNKYWSGESSISMRVYADAIRTLKDRLFSQR